MDTSLTPKRNLPRDLFLHLLAMVMLYWSAVSFVTLVWQCINNFFPDTLNYWPGMINSYMRFAIASLIIVFPIFLLTSWFLNKIYSKESLVRESKIRKWLIYVTLFIASLIIIGDLVSVINIFLSGEITARFILKAITILAVAAVVFGYYLDDVRKESPTKLAKPFAWGTSVIVLIAVIGAFFVVGSPQSARQLQFDQQRVNDLTSIQYQVVNYWQAKQKLPAQLSDLNNAISGFTVPQDPENKAAYEYAITDATALSFQLCATFDQPNQNPTVMQPMADGDQYNQSWDHSSGHFCFTRTIDQQLYPPITPKK